MAEATEKKKKEFAKALTDRFEIHPSVQPGKFDSGFLLGRVETDLSNPGCVDAIEGLVKAHPYGTDSKKGEQTLFKPKNAAPAPKGGN